MPACGASRQRHARSQVQSAAGRSQGIECTAVRIVQGSGTSRCSLRNGSLTTQPCVVGSVRRSDGSTFALLVSRREKLQAASRVAAAARSFEILLWTVLYSGSRTGSGAHRPSREALVSCKVRGHSSATQPCSSTPTQLISLDGSDLAQHGKRTLSAARAELSARRRLGSSVGWLVADPDCLSVLPVCLQCSVGILAGFSRGYGGVSTVHVDRSVVQRAGGLWLRPRRDEAASGNSCAALVLRRRVSERARLMG